MKKVGIILLTFMLVLSCACTNTNIEDTNGNIYLLYKNSEDVNKYSATLKDKSTTEFVVLLKIDENEENDLYGITGSKSDEYNEKLYYDVFKIRNDKNEALIYFHIEADNEIANNITLCKEDVNTKKITKYNIPSHVYENVDNLGLNTVDVGENKIIYMDKSMEQIVKKEGGEERNVWFHFLPLNCTYNDITTDGFSMKCSNKTCNIVSVLTPDEIMKNTGKTISYSPLNIVINGMIETENNWTKQDIQNIELEYKNHRIK